MQVNWLISGTVACEFLRATHSAALRAEDQRSRAPGDVRGTRTGRQGVRSLLPQQWGRETCIPNSQLLSHVSWA